MTQLVEPHTLLWDKADYLAAAEAGFFRGKRVELIEGEIIDISPMTSRHAAIVFLVQKALERVFGDGYYVTCQTPLDLGAASEPEPDLAVCEGSVMDYLDHKPTHALLVVEVAESSLRYDRTRKASLYARAGIPEYWIVNVRERTIEVYRNPDENAAHYYGYAYRLIMHMSAKDRVSPLAAPAAEISVAEVVPQ
ncbi:MAG TPA: Uma2 family endonuclease [Herpetosiphonaceae bacterium]